MDWLIASFIFSVLGILSVFVVPSIIQTRLMFHNAFSRGVLIDTLLKKPHTASDISATSSTNLNTNNSNKGNGALGHSSKNDMTKNFSFSDLTAYHFLEKKGEATRNNSSGHLYNDNKRAHLNNDATYYQGGTISNSILSQPKTGKLVKNGSAKNVTFDANVQTSSSPPSTQGTFSAPRTKVQLIQLPEEQYTPEMSPHLPSSTQYSPVPLPPPHPNNQLTVNGSTNVHPSSSPNQWAPTLLGYSHSAGVESSVAFSNMTQSGSVPSSPAPPSLQARSGTASPSTRNLGGRGGRLPPTILQGDDRPIPKTVSVQEYKSSLANSPRMSPNPANNANPNNPNPNKLPTFPTLNARKA